MAIGPRRGGAVIGREQGVLCRMPVDHLRQIAPGNTAIVAGSNLGPFGLPIVATRTASHARRKLALNG
jgi:hypothetical protein